MVLARDFDSQGSGLYTCKTSRLKTRVKSSSFQGSTAPISRPHDLTTSLQPALPLALKCSKLKPLNLQDSSRPGASRHISSIQVKFRTPQASRCFELQDASRFKRKTQDFKIQDSRTPQDASSSKAPQASVQASRRVKTSRSVKTRPKTFKTHNSNLRRASTLKASRYSETSMGRLKTRVASRHLKTPQVQGASSFKTLRLQASGSRYLKTPDFNLLQDASRLEASRYFKTSVGNCSRRLKFKTSVGHCTRFSRRLKTQDLKTAQDSRLQDALKNSSRFKSFDSGTSNDCFYDLY
ncbi:hypothetical protein K438DRAFT_1747863 [Mycena galopus ATCC 62051]|nr:hypothetical protein K438DRAFT_1747863 [Mycena galopus ATCC 62051]